MSESGDDRPVHHHHHHHQHHHHQGKRRGNHERAAEETEKELASEQIQIQSKRFYIDVKENARGRFVKLAEVGVGGRKSRIMMSMNAAAELKHKLASFAELNAQLPPLASSSSTSAGKEESEEKSRDTDGGGGGGGGGGTLKSETIVKDRKRYYLDLKENQRGRFVRISMVVTRGPRAFLAIPAQGLAEFNDQLSELLDRYGAEFITNDADAAAAAAAESGSPQHQQAAATGGGGGSESELLPESKSFRADNKTFYFDCGSNQRGVFLKISEVRQNRYRTSITVPEKYLEQFRDQLNEFLSKVAAASNGALVSSSSSADTPAAAVAASTTGEKSEVPGELPGNE